MNSKSYLLLIPGLLLFGCQSVGWYPIDGASGAAAAIAEARKACRLEAKLAGLQNAQQQRDEALSQAETDASKQAARDEFNQIRRQVWREIDICMARQGYRRSG